ncbi:hypothetical protein TYRP_008840 [Tyrophagus putrescentiae]|nr:hypothetical protein TYRP_008840 [Tyrophagus putrescentiae]
MLLQLSLPKLVRCGPTVAVATNLLPLLVVVLVLVVPVFSCLAPGSFFVLRFYIFLLPSRLLTTHKGPYERNYSD